MNIRELAGQVIDEYRLENLIGMGGMSAVYQAYQEELERRVAIKLLSEHLAEQANYVERFNREAKMAASLEHPHIVPVYDFGIQDGLSYVVMRLLNSTFEQRLTTLTRDDLVETLTAVGKALDYAHRRGIVHRDIKPSNIMYDSEGVCYLVDFGIAKVISQDVSLTNEQIVLGTPQYMSPEQWRGENLSPAIDQYALAAVTFKALTGRLPFIGATPSELMTQHLNSAVPSASAIQASLPRAVDAVLIRAMAKNPTERYATVGAFVSALSAALQAPVSEVTQPNPVVMMPSEVTQPNQVVNVPPPIAESTVQNPRMTAAPMETIEQAQGRAFMPAPNVAVAEAEPPTMLMQVASGAMLGLAVLFGIIIVIVIAVIVLFAPETPPNDNSAVFEPPTSDAPAVSTPTSINPEIVLTERGAVIPTVAGTINLTGAQARSTLYEQLEIPVRDAVLSVDGRMIASAHGDNLVRLWQNGTASTPLVLQGHNDVVSAVAFSPDGRLLASGGRDMRVILWDTATGSQAANLTGHTGAVRDLIFSPDGTLLASAAEDGTVRLWSVANRNFAQSINADGTRVLAVAFSPDSQTIVTGGRNGIVRLWNRQTGALIRNMEGHGEEVRSVAFSPDGQLIASSSTDNSVILWRASSGEALQRMTMENDIFVVTFSPDSRIVASGGRDNNIRLFDANTGSQIAALTGHRGWVLGLAFSPDGQTLLSGSGDGSVRLWAIAR